MHQKRSTVFLFYGLLVITLKQLASEVSSFIQLPSKVQYAILGYQKGKNDVKSKTDFRLWTSYNTSEIVTLWYNRQLINKECNKIFPHNLNDLLLAGMDSGEVFEAIQKMNFFPTLKIDSYWLATNEAFSELISYYSLPQKIRENNAIMKEKQIESLIKFEEIFKKEPSAFNFIDEVSSSTTAGLIKYTQESKSPLELAAPYPALLIFLVKVGACLDFFREDVTKYPHLQQFPDIIVALTTKKLSEILTPDQAFNEVAYLLDCVNGDEIRKKYEEIQAKYNYKRSARYSNEVVKNDKKITFTIQYVPYTKPY